MYAHGRSGQLFRRRSAQIDPLKALREE